MASDISYFIGVSWPRSGHHLLERILATYFGDEFGYCEHYKPEDCCRSVPCIRADINLSKNHDYDSVVPIADGGKYLIQYRKFCPSMVSGYELHVRANNAKDSEKLFYIYSYKQLDSYLKFLQKWASATAKNATFLRVSYESLTTSPFETAETIINAFAPNRAFYEGELNWAINSVDRISVKDSRVFIDSTLGVGATRTVHEFRYYNEMHFKDLDARSRDAYDKMAALPVLIRSHASNSRPKATAAASNKIKQDKNVLYVDATGVLANAGIPPTGNPRVQQFLVGRAIADRDKRVQVILFDRNLCHYRSPSVGEISQLKSLEIATNGEPKIEESDKIQLFHSILKRIRESPRLGKNFDRSSAALLANHKRRGPYYFVAKIVIRAYRYYRRALDAKRKPDEDTGLHLTNGIVLLSHEIINGRLFPKAIPHTDECAFICHDVIPWLHPEYTNPAKDAQRVGAYLSLLVQGGAHALCTSNASRAMQEQFGREVGNAAGCIDQFPLPSILYGKAKSLDRIAPLKAEEPFILYCSTIEVRKNHLMLARIWNEARRQGVALPKLVCVGKWGWGVEDLRKYLNANPALNEDIKFVGAIDDNDLIDLYRSALFGVMPSLVEGWGYGASECLDFGLPVIVSTVPGLVEAVRGLMPAIDLQDQAAWYAKIRLLSENKDEIAELRNRIRSGYRPVSNSESWETIKAALWQQSSS